jgi:hypothetical protein
LIKIIVFCFIFYLTLLVHKKLKCVHTFYPSIPRVKNEIEVFLKKFNGSNYELKSAEKYFKKFPNNVEKIESINLNNSDEDSGKEILVNNSQSIKKMEIKRKN